MHRLSTSHGAAEWAATPPAGRSPWPRLARLARRLGVDVVHSNSLHTWYGWAAARLVRRPHVVHAREIVVQSRRRAARRARAVPPLRDPRDRGVVRGRRAARPRQRRRARRVPRPRRVRARARRARSGAASASPDDDARRRRGRPPRPAQGPRRAARRVRAGPRARDPAPSS